MLLIQHLISAMNLEFIYFMGSCTIKLMTKCGYISIIIVDLSLCIAIMCPF